MSTTTTPALPRMATFTTFTGGKDAPILEAGNPMASLFDDFHDATIVFFHKHKIADEHDRALTVVNCFCDPHVDSWIKNNKACINEEAYTFENLLSKIQQPTLSDLFTIPYHDITTPVMSVPNSPPAILPSAFIETVPSSTPLPSAIHIPATTVSITLPSAPASFTLGNGSDTENENLSDVSVPPCPISIPHLVWIANVISNDDFPFPVDCLLDSRAHLVLIRPEVVADLGLPVQRLKNPVAVSLALNGVNTTTFLDNCVTLSVSTVNNAWTSRLVTTIIAPGLCMNILLGLPFLTHNKIIIDHEKCFVVHRPSGFDILNENAVLPKHKVPKPTPHKHCLIIVQQRKDFIKELKWKCSECLWTLQEGDTCQCNKHCQSDN